jgi:thiol peroxidase
MEVTLKGNVCNTMGTLPKIGSNAPGFKLVDKDLRDRSLGDFPGKKLIAAVPSLDTGVCLTSAKKFNEKGQNFTLIYVSADLPFAGSRICKVEKLDNIHTLSMMRNKDFAVDYGVLLIDGPLEGLCARAIFVIDENNKILYSELVKEISAEPNYEAAISVVS